MTEDELLQGITDAATYMGWLWHHIRRSDLGVQQGHAGFPDLVLAKAGQVVFAELKTELGYLTHDQEAWLRELQGDWGDSDDICDVGRAPNVDVHVVRPATYDAFLRDVLGYQGKGLRP